MKCAASLKQERDARIKTKLDSAYVIDVIESFDGDKDEEFGREVECKGLGEYKYCIIMPAANKDLHFILSQENVAGKDLEATKRMFKDILQCVAHLHGHELIHGDLKPFNIVRNSKGKMILIDLDASRKFGSVDIANKQYSPAYCPPEAVWVDAVTGDAVMYFSNPNFSKDVSVLSQPSFDMWALGAVLYEMCAGVPLFQSSYGNMLDVPDLHLLYNWDDSVKIQKLEKIADSKLRNMVSRLLCKDPQKRMPIAAALAHPFITGSAPVRMVGDAPKYDVFISYRVASDSERVRILHDKLKAERLTVFWDKRCLPDGVPWEEGFCDGLVDSKVYVCLISRDAIGHSTNPRQCFNRLTESSACDNVLLEQQLALELRAMGVIEFIYPVFIGEKRSDGTYAPFDWGSYGDLPDVVVSSVLKKLTGHLSRQALGVPMEPGKTVKQVVADIRALQGIKIEGYEDAAFEAVKSTIKGMCKSGPAAAAMDQGAVAMAPQQSPRSPRSSPRARLQLARVEAEQLESQFKLQQPEKEQQQQLGDRDLQVLSKEDRAEAAKLLQQIEVAKPELQLEKQQLQSEIRQLQLEKERLQSEIRQLRLEKDQLELEKQRSLQSEK